MSGPRDGIPTVIMDWRSSVSFHSIIEELHMSTAPEMENKGCGARPRHMQMASTLKGIGNIVDRVPWGSFLGGVADLATTD